MTGASEQVKRGAGATAGLWPCLHPPLAGLLNADEPEAVAGLLARLESSALAASASMGELSKGRLALRLLAALTAVNVVDLGSLLARSQACLQQLIRLADDSALGGGPHVAWATDRGWPQGWHQSHAHVSVHDWEVGTGRR